MQTAIEAQEQISNNFFLMVAGVAFGGASGFGIGYAVARKYRIAGSRNVYLISGILGLILAGIIMVALQEKGASFAFCSLIGLFFGVRHGGEVNDRRQKRKARLRRRHRQHRQRE